MLRYKSYVTEQHIKQAVSYLAGDKKEYIEITLNDENYWDSIVQLTPAGVNLAERDIYDLGVVTDE
jgi:hypothetical protein